MEVDDEEGFVGEDLFAAVVLFAFDAAVAAGEFRPEGFGDAEYFAVLGVCVCVVFWWWGVRCKCVSEGLCGTGGSGWCFGALVVSDVHRRMVR